MSQKPSRTYQIPLRVVSGQVEGAFAVNGNFQHSLKGGDFFKAVEPVLHAILELEPTVEGTSVLLTLVVEPPNGS